MHANAASRMRWYSTSVSVCAGATVIESPVCTPIASKFSIEQMTTTLSAWSRITSSSYSFHPTTLRSMRISEIGLAARPRSATRCISSVVVRDAGAAAAEDERGPHDHRVADLGRDRERLVDRVRDARRRHAQADLAHRGLEPLAVLGGADRLDARADQLDAVRVEHAGFVELDREVERGLAAERREQRVGTLALDDARRATATSSGST